MKFTDWFNKKKKEAPKIERVGNIEFFLGKKTMFAKTTYDDDTPLGENSFLQLYKF